MPRPKPARIVELTPTPGWKGRAPAMTWQNPRAPAVPASLNLSIEKYFAACALMGITSAQVEEPDKEWLAQWALDMGEVMARKAKKRWG